MSTHTIFAAKAENYARYRWDYAQAAIRDLFVCTNLPTSACVADIGAGTGILTRHLAARFRRVYAVEPNAEMRRFAAQALRSQPNCDLIAACAEATGLPAAAVDLITAGQAIHWFDPEPARRELRRILKPDGWLALLRNYSIADELSDTLDAIFVPENGVQTADASPRRPSTPPEYYFSGQLYRSTYAFELSQDWQTFLGALLSASDSPVPSHLQFTRFVAAARSVFDRFQVSGHVTVRGETELIVGRMVQFQAG